MANKIIISGIPRYNGEYDLELDGDEMTTLEWRWVKKISEYLPLTIVDGWDGRDPDLFLAFAVIALARAGKIDEADALTAADLIARAPRSAVRLEIGETETPSGPPAEAPQTGPSREDTGDRSSLTSDDRQENDLSRTGHQPSETPTTDQGLHLATSRS